MKYSGRITFSILLIIGLGLLYNSYEKISRLEQEILGLSTITTISEKFGDITCIGSGTNRGIEGYAICSYDGGDNSRTYSGEFYNHMPLGYGKAEKKNGDVLEGYFYSGGIVAGKINMSNGDAIKGLWTLKEDGSHLLEMGKIFKISNGVIETIMGDFQDGALSYGMYRSIFEGTEFYTLGSFNNGDIIPNDGYFIRNGCIKLTNGNAKEITRTITNTVYRNNIDITKGLVPINPLGSQSNPYNVKIELK